MVEVLIGVVLLAIGGAGGWFARKLMEAAKRGARMPETDAARDIERVRAERQAFEALMGYNARDGVWDAKGGIRQNETEQRHKSLGAL